MSKYCIASPHKNELWYDYRLYVNLIDALAELGHQHEAGAKNRIYFLGGPLRRFYPKVGAFDPAANNIALIYCHMETLQDLRQFSKVFVPSEFVKNYYVQQVSNLSLNQEQRRNYQTSAEIDVIRPFSSLKPMNEHRPKYNCDVMFMGTPRVRPIVEAALGIVEKHNLTMHIIGPNWATYPGNPKAKQYSTETSIRYHQIPQAVRGAAICLHDHHDGMNEFQTCSHKYIDMLSAGGFIVSDYNLDVKNVYRGHVFENEADLESLILEYKDDRQKRDEFVKSQQNYLHQQTTLDAAKKISEFFV